MEVGLGSDLGDVPNCLRNFRLARIDMFGVDIWIVRVHKALPMNNNWVMVDSASNLVDICVCWPTIRYYVGTRQHVMTNEWFECSRRAVRYLSQKALWGWVRTWGWGWGREGEDENNMVSIISSGWGWDDEVIDTIFSSSLTSRPHLHPLHFREKIQRIEEEKIKKFKEENSTQEKIHWIWLKMNYFEMQFHSKSKWNIRMRKFRELEKKKWWN